MTLTDLICWVDRFAATKAFIITVVGSAEHVFSLIPVHLGHWGHWGHTNLGVSMRVCPWYTWY